MSYNIPDSAVGEFYSEAEEIISRATSYLQQLESQNYSDKLIDSLYRDIHTLKGSAQLFGFNGIGIIGHALESTLEPIRRKKVGISKDLVTTAFACLDLIDQMLKNPEAAKIEGPLEQQITKMLGAMTHVALDLFNANLTIRHFPTGEEDLSALLESHKKSLTPQSEKRELREIKVAAKEKNKSRSTKGSNSKGPSDSDSAGSHAKVKPVSSQNDELFKATGGQSQPSNNKSDKQGPLLESLKKPEVADSAEHGTPENSSIRVQISLLDRLMNLVGEIVLVRNQVLQYSQNNDNVDFLNLSQKLNVVTSELQADVMKTRLQPISSILSKFQRVVRDIARDLNKNIELTLKGTETEVDRSLLEAIKDPLTHIIRNSCDHGLESSEERLRAGKPEIGNILINAFQEGGQAIIDISDDGRGLNLAKITQVAIERKLISAEKARQLSQRDIAHLIFAPGFSTADQVSALSGRGVGMDVVRTNIERVGGTVEITFEAGKGTRIRLRIPLTLTIVPAMMIRSGGETFAIPQVKLQELVLVDEQGQGPKIEYLQGQPIFRLRGELLPLVFINSELRFSDPTKDAITSPSHRNIVVLSSDGKSFGLIVDEILDTADIVVKSLPKFIKNLHLYSGATIMGDGGVCLILDIAGLAERAHVIQTGNKQDLKSELINQTNSTAKMPTQEMLFFSLNEPGQFCIPLALVHRLEEFDKKQLVVTGSETIVQYRDSVLPIIDLNETLDFPIEKNRTEGQRIPVIVISKRRRFFGVRVNAIQDVADLVAEIADPMVPTKGILGTLVHDHHIANVVDILNILDQQITPQGPEFVGAVNAPTAVAAQGSGLQILVAEDSPFFINQIKRILEPLNIEVTHAPNGEDALRILKSSRPGHFQLLLTDIEMPKMTGFELAEKVRAESKWAGLPIIALTTRFSELDCQRGRAIGFNQYLEKLNPNELIDSIYNEVRGVSA